jgi:hypothetical protein
MVSSDSKTVAMNWLLVFVCIDETKQAPVIELSGRSCSYVDVLLRLAKNSRTVFTLKVTGSILIS